MNPRTRTGFAGRLFAALVRAYRALWTVNPIGAGFALMAIGIVFFIASFPVGVDFVGYRIVADGPVKQVGYVPALNWSLISAILWPATIFTMLHTVRRFERSVHTFAAHHMLAHGDWRAATTAHADALIDRIWRRATPVGTFFFLAGFAIIAWDWWTVVAGPLIKGALPILPGQTDIRYELDWSIAALFGSYAPDAANLPNIDTNFIFSTAIYLVMALESGVVLAFYGFLVGVSVEIYALSEEKRDVFLTPNVADRDRRRGFEAFAGFFTGVLMTTLLGYLACYLMRIQNLYLRANTCPPAPGKGDCYYRLTDMLFQQIADSATSATNLPNEFTAGAILKYIGDPLRELFGALFAAGEFADTQAYFGSVLLVIVFLLIAAALFAVLRMSAIESRKRVLDALEVPKEAKAVERYYHLPAATIAEKIDPAAMDVWPLRWPKMNGFIALLALGFLCFIFYRLAIIWIALQLWPILRGKYKH